MPTTPEFLAATVREMKPNGGWPWPSVEITNSNGQKVILSAGMLREALQAVATHAGRPDLLKFE